MDENELGILLERLVSLPHETEWVEFKLNNSKPELVGEYISSLSNSACLFGEASAYLIYGVSDNKDIQGTKFKPKSAKHKGQLLEHWLTQHLSPKIDFRIYEFVYNGKNIVIFEIPATNSHPVRFSNESFIRVGSYNRKLKDFPDKERKIWTMNPGIPFELEIAKSGLSEEEIDTYLDVKKYYEILNLPYPTENRLLLEKFVSEQYISKEGHTYSITNLGALLFAKQLDQFETLSNKALRFIIYLSDNKLKTKLDRVGSKAYVAGFKGLIQFISDQLPQNEVLSDAFRETVYMYPLDSIRELVANTLVHQDLHSDRGPRIEIYSNRIEFSNAGRSLIKPERFIDEERTRNSLLMKHMRKLKICEEKGSGIDRVVFESEFYQLPAPDFFLKDTTTHVTLYAQKPFSDMSKSDKVRACYQHCCLKHISNVVMTNQTLRERFKIPSKNSALITRVINETLAQGLIKNHNPDNKSRKHASYIPFWA